MEKEDRTSTVREVSSGERREVERPTHASRTSEEDLGWSYSDSLLPWSLGYVSSARRNGVPLSQPQTYKSFERATRPATSILHVYFIISINLVDVEKQTLCMVRCML